MNLLNIFEYTFMQHALIAASVVGLTAPLVGVFLVQRRLALLGDGIGHIALTGIGIAILTGQAPIYGALAAAVIGAVTVEFLRARSKLAGDTALSIIFYGGIAGGVLLTSLGSRTGSNALTGYLFGSLTTITRSDLVAVSILGVAILIILSIFGRQLLAISIDPEHAHVQGMNLTFLSTVIAALSAVTVTVGMRAVGLLLVSAIMIIPVVAAQQLTRSFQQTAIVASLIGWLSAVFGLVFSYQVDAPPGSTIILTALLVFILLATSSKLIQFKKSSKIKHAVASEH